MEQEILVALLTETQKNELVGQLYAPDSYFNPIQDAEGNWIISTQEQEFCTNPEFLWVKNLPLIPYKPNPGPGPGPDPGPTGPTGNIS
jgi:hypothetical protein